MSSEKVQLRKNKKIYYQRFNSAKISHKLVSKLASYNNFNSPKEKKSTRNNTKLLITNVLSASKHYLINGNVNDSQNDFIENIRYKYPYKPNIFLKLNKDERINLLSSYKKQNNILSSFESSISTFKSSTNNTIKNNLVFYPNYNSFSIKKNKNYEKNKEIKITKKTLTNENSKINMNDDSELIKVNINFNFNINNKTFLKYVDDINSDKNYLNIYKNNLREYFNNNCDKNAPYFLKKVLDDFKLDENEAEKEKYFFTNYHSAKINNFVIKNNKINLKLSSLKIIFYEISENKEKYGINTKLKFPFEFLSIFYGLNFNDFINFLISLIDYNFTKNKFYIDYNNFSTKIEEAKILFDFFKEKSFANSYYLNNAKEYFLLDWDVKGKNNEIKHFKIKILLPQIKLKVICEQNLKIKFYSYISTRTMDNLIKNSFNNWDFFIFIYFSQHRLFRYELNKILCNKYSKKINAQIISKENLAFNLTNSKIKINTYRKNYSSYCFFYTLKMEGKNETYFINFRMPKINISFHAFKKNFEFDFRRFHQFNKLTKYIHPEDLIKYSMTIKKFKLNKKFEEKQLQKKDNPKKTLRPSKRDSDIINNLDMKGRKENIKKYFKNKIKEREEMNIINTSNNNEHKEIIKDIDLNLDNYIFNFDESIFKFINTNKEQRKNNILNINKSNGDDPPINNNNEKNLNVDIGTMEFSWTNRDGLTNVYKLDQKKSQYLFDFPPEKWKNYVEKNINKIITGISNTKRSKTQKRLSFFPKL